MLEDGTEQLPTFGLETMETREVHLHEVHIDEETSYADLRPVQGKLFHLGGTANCPVGNSNTATVVLSSELERKSVSVECGFSFRFDKLAPGYYEFFATDRMGNAGFYEMHADHDSDGTSISLTQLPQVDVEVRHNGSRAADLKVTLTGHRQDLADLDNDKPIPLRGTLAPGH